MILPKVGKPEWNNMAAEFVKHSNAVKMAALEVRFSTDPLNPETGQLYLNLAIALDKQQHTVVSNWAPTKPRIPTGRKVKHGDLDSATKLVLVGLGRQARHRL